MPHKRAKRSVREKDRQEKYVAVCIGRSTVLCLLRSHMFVSRGNDLAPSGNLSTKGIPKSISRILDAAKIREEFKQRKRTTLDGSFNDSGRPKKKRKQDEGNVSEKTNAATTVKEKANKIKIQPGETLAHFNRVHDESMLHLSPYAYKHSPERTACTVLLHR